MNIPQYITELKDFLDQKIEALDSGLSKRKAYIEAFLAGFSGYLTFKKDIFVPRISLIS